MTPPTTSDAERECLAVNDGVSVPINFRARALTLWPGVDRRRLGRAGGDLLRTARVIERGTALSLDEIMGMLRGAPRRVTTTADHWYDPDAVTFT